MILTSTVTPERIVGDVYQPVLLVTVHFKFFIIFFDNVSRFLLIFDVSFFKLINYLVTV